MNSLISQLVYQVGRSNMAAGERSVEMYECVVAMSMCRCGRMGADVSHRSSVVGSSRREGEELGGKRVCTQAFLAARIVKTVSVCLSGCLSACPWPRCRNDMSSSSRD